MAAKKRDSHYRAAFSVRKGKFHQWLGKREDEPITDEDIAKGKAAGGHAAKMANFAANARHWSHSK